MKKTILNILTVCTLFFATALNAQVGIGVPSENIHPSAELEVKSTTKGFLPPRMTKAERDAIVTPAAGLIVWCNDCGAKGEIQVYNGTEWTNMIGGIPLGLLPSLETTSTASEITSSTAISGGNVLNDYDSPITARGICWSTSQNPTTADNKTTDTGSIGIFSSVLNGLIPNTTYYVRGYATNASGTGYGTQISFTTFPDMDGPGGFGGSGNDGSGAGGSAGPKL